MAPSETNHIRSFISRLVLFCRDIIAIRGYNNDKIAINVPQMSGDGLKVLYK